MGRNARGSLVDKRVSDLLWSPPPEGETVARRPTRTAIYEWMAEERLSDSDLARQLGVDRSTVWRWRHGITTPEQAVGQKLIRISGGRLTWDTIITGR